MALRSNGYGSWVLNIVIEVKSEFADEARAALRATVAPTQADPEWLRMSYLGRSGRAGDDEGVLFNLMHSMPKIPDGSWRIIWEASEY